MFVHLGIRTFECLEVGKFAKVAKYTKGRVETSKRRLVEDRSLETWDDRNYSGNNRCSIERILDSRQEASRDEVTSTRTCSRPPNDQLLAQLLALLLRERALFFFLSNAARGEFSHDLTGSDNLLAHRYKYPFFVHRRFMYAIDANIRKRVLLFFSSVLPLFLYFSWLLFVARPPRVYVKSLEHHRKRNITSDRDRGERGGSARFI